MVLRRRSLPPADPSVATNRHRASLLFRLCPSTRLITAKVRSCPRVGTEFKEVESEANEPNGVKSIKTNAIAPNWKERTQRGYLACFQRVNCEKRPILAIVYVSGVRFAQLPLWNCQPPLRIRIGYGQKWSERSWNVQ
jgi:hypothetical protein